LGSTPHLGRLPEVAFGFSPARFNHSTLPGAYGSRIQIENTGSVIFQPLLKQQKTNHLGQAGRWLSRQPRLVSLGKKQSGK
jgi:hypothetical protein